MPAAPGRVTTPADWCETRARWRTHQRTAAAGRGEQVMAAVQGLVEAAQQGALHMHYCIRNQAMAYGKLLI
jgi:hypothetical protein